jgi:hypothetical protein
MRGAKKFEIRDWAGNVMFGGIRFKSFEDAWGHIYKAFPNATEEDLGEYYVEPGESREARYLDPKDPRGGRRVSV